MTFLQDMNGTIFTEKSNMIKSATFSLLFFVMELLWIKTEQLYVDPRTGNDTNSGIKSQPLNIGDLKKKINYRFFSPIGAQVIKSILLILIFAVSWRKQLKMQNLISSMGKVPIANFII